MNLLVNKATMRRENETKSKRLAGKPNKVAEPTSELYGQGSSE